MVASKVKDAGQSAGDNVPTREEIMKTIEKQLLEISKSENIFVKLKKKELEFYMDLAIRVIGLTMEKGGDVREQFNRLIRHYPKLASLFFDMVEGKTFSEAFEKANKQGLKTFIWSETGKVYSTDYNGSPREQMDVYGIVNEQKQDLAWWNKRIANNLCGSGYEHPIQRFFKTVLLNEKEPECNAPKQEEDYFNMYVGRPQKYDSIGISDYTPANPSEVNGKRLPAKYLAHTYKDKALSDDISKYWAIFAKHLFEEDNHRESRFQNFYLQHFKMSLGYDEKKGWYICYHDTWDIAPMEHNTDFGKPFEVYDRIYFDPDKISEAYEEQIDLLKREGMKALPTMAICTHYGKTRRRYQNIINGTLYIEDLDKKEQTVITKEEYGTKEVTYNMETNNAKKEVYKNSDEEVIGSIERSYTKGAAVPIPLVTKVVHKNGNGEVTKTETYTYNKADMLKEKIIMIGDEVVEHTKFTYDEEDGRKRTGVVIIEKGKPIQGYGPEYEKAKKQEEEEAKKSAEKQDDLSKNTEANEQTRHLSGGELRWADEETIKKLTEDEQAKNKTMMNEAPKKVRQIKNGRGLDNKLLAAKTRQYGNGKGVDDLIGKIHEQQKQIQAAKTASNHKKMTPT